MNSMPSTNPISHRLPRTSEGGVERSETEEGPSSKSLSNP